MTSIRVRVLALLLVAASLPACGAGSGSGTLTPTVAPGIPSQVEVRSGSRSVTVSWKGGASGASYVVLRSLNREGPFFPISIPSGFVDPTTYVDESLVNGTTYYYAVQAANAFGTSARSAAAAAMPAFRPVVVSAGFGLFAAVLPDGSVWNWGMQANGVQATAPSRIPELKEMTGVSVQYNTGFAVRFDGRVWGWGARYLGSLGDGPRPIEPYVPPALNPTLTGIISVAAGTNCGLALAADGTVWGWGGNSDGQVGTLAADPVAQLTPIPLENLSGVSAIAHGGIHCLALRSDGLVFSWGANYHGELGIGSLAPAMLRAPAQVVDLNGVVAVSAGPTYSLALRQDGTVWGWGENVQGVLGTGASIGALVTNPLKVAGLSDVAGISAGGDHALALLANGRVTAWGSNSSGQLGTGFPSDPVPRVVVGLPLARTVAAASGASLAVAEDGSTWTWGGNSEGQLGNSTGSTLAVASEAANLTGVTSIGTGRAYSMIVKTAGTAWGWGDGTDAKLGSGSAIATPVVTPVQAAGLTLATQVDGSVFASMALRSDGTVHAWGSNIWAQLGLPAGTTMSTQPAAVPGLSGITEISMGANHCLARKNDGSLWAWGLNNFGQLGNPTGGSVSYVAAPVPGIAGVISAAGGTNFTLALRDDGTVWSWGDGSQGQLGSGVPTPTPFQVVQLDDVRVIAAGESHSLAIRGDGRVWAWGASDRGKLGVGDHDPRAIPAQVVGLENAIAVAAGTYHSLALRSDGTVWAWGDNRDGQLGNPVAEFSLVPVQVLDLGQVVGISTGNWHNLALKSNGTVWTWGKNDVSQAGRPNLTGSPVPVPIEP